MVRRQLGFSDFEPTTAIKKSMVEKFLSEMEACLGSH
jgi:hypothetical protein